MKCEKCGKELDSLEVDMFNRDGSDSWYDVEITFNYDVAFMDVLPSWTGNELTEEEQTETIRCPHCKQYPFKKRMIDTDTYVKVIMYLKGEDDAEEK